MIGRMPTQVQGRGRAAALPTEERRSAIVAAALPLFLEQGTAITTREIATAAGIAEGTIFRVFSDKTALLDAVIAAALDPSPTEAAIQQIDASLSFEDRLVAAVEILRRRTLYVFNVLSAAAGTTRGVSQQRSTDLPALIAIFESAADQLNRAPADAARVLRGLTFACVHPAFGTDTPLSSDEIVGVLLDGIRVASPKESPC